MTQNQENTEEIKAVRNIHIAQVVAIVAVAVTSSTLFFYSASTLSDKISVENLGWFFGIITLLCLLAIANAGSGGLSVKISKDDDKEDEEDDDEIVVGATREEIEERLQSLLGREPITKEVDEFIEYLNGDVTDWVKDNGQSFVRENLKEK